MKSKTNRLKMIFYAPGVVAAIRLAVTLLVFIANPAKMPLRFLQVIPLCILGVSVFTYFKLYSDGDPVISLMVPTIMHILLIFAFKRQLVIIPFALLIILDICYLVVKGIKGSMYPFEVEGDEDDVGNFDDLEVEEPAGILQ